MNASEFCLINEVVDSDRDLLVVEADSADISDKVSDRSFCCEAALFISSPNEEIEIIS